MEKTSLTLQQRMEILTKDFLERDGNSFVRIRRTGRLGWENTLPEDGSYSSIILKPCSQEELIKNAYRLACNMITVMDSDKKVRVRITSDQSATDSRIVYVATRVFDEPDMTNGQKLDAFLGFAIHEGCHLLYTDFSMMPLASNKTVGNILNIIEDERIERECGEHKPGLVNFVGVTKYYSFDKYASRIEAAGGMDNLTWVQRFLNCIVSYIRYPKSLKVSELEKFSEEMLAVKQILTPYPSSTREALDAAERIYDVIRQEAEKQRQKQHEEMKQTEGMNSGGTSMNDSEEKSQDNGQDLEKQLSSMNERLEGICSGTTAGLTESDQCDTVKQDNGKVGQVCEGTIERGLSRGSYIEKASEDKSTYDDSLSRVKRYVPSISKSLTIEGTDRTFCIRGQRAGVLDTSKLAEGRQGVPSVYNRIGEVKTNKVTVCILIDESGSMWGPGEIAARDTAVLLNEALSKVPNVNLYIYGHTASRETTTLYVYREPGFNRRYALGTTDSRAGNHDSVAIREAAARVRKTTGEKVLFFMVSDGAPNESTELVRRAVRDVEKDGFHVVAISIDPYYDPSTMYDHNVNLTELSTLAVDLGKMIKKAIKTNTRKQINIL